MKTHAKAAKRFFRKLLKGLQYVPRVMITDKLKSYGAAKREILPGVEHRQHPRAQQSSGKLTPTHATA
jgi:putative transposase